MMNRILTINAGSSSLKYSLFDVENDKVIAEGRVEHIGGGDAHVASHASAMRDVLNGLINNSLLNQRELMAIGHRVVHGGEIYSRPVVIDAEVVEAIQRLIPLAPLHNTINLACIEVTRELFPQVPQVAVFDTAFHQTMPEHAYRYALPENCYRDHQVRRYGFHGTSHQYVVKQAALHLDQPPEQLNLITLHLGNGASMAAIKNGVCVDTSMGMTPLEGLMMGSRCGDLDPAVPFYLAQAMNKSNQEINELLNEKSGFMGVCGVYDMREVHRRVEFGDEKAKLALEMFCYRIRKYIGAYCAVLGRVDALIFTAGIGENDVVVRRRCCEGLDAFGIKIDSQLNEDSAVAIQQDNANVKVLVIPTDEAREIFEQTLVCLTPNKQ